MKLILLHQKCTVNLLLSVIRYYKYTYQTGFSHTLNNMESKEIQQRIAENLRKIRKSKKMTQLDLAIKCDMSEAMIKNIELNRSWPSEKTLAQITNALEIDVYRLFLPLAKDFEKEIKLSIKDEITKSLRKYIEEQLNTLELE